jgi:molecular chaperone DnaK (HSP70)
MPYFHISVSPFYISITDKIISSHRHTFNQTEKENIIMAKTKIEKIASIEEEIQQLENKRKELIQAQKKGGAQRQNQTPLQAHGAD